MDAEPEKKSSGRKIDEQSVRKTLRYLSETGKKLDEYASQSKSVEDLLSTGGPTFILRMRLKDLVKRALNSDPLGIGSKSLDLGWKKIFYDPIRLSRQLRKNGGSWTDSETAFMSSHIYAGTGHYLEILRWVTEEFGIPEGCEVLRSELVMSDKPINKERNDDERRWAKGTIHKCLICLGDLSRYKLELAQSPEERESDIAVAKKYYRLALLVDADDGSPYNQLATLSHNQNCGLDSLFLYLKCLTSPVQFPGCRVNLKNLCEKNSTKFLKTEESVNFDDLMMRSKNAELESSIVYFIHLINETIFQDGTLSDLCQKALRSVQRCLYYPREDSSGEDHEECLKRDIAVKMVLILLLVIEKVDSEGEKVKVSMMKAYLLALFSHFVTKLLGDLYFRLYGPEAMLEYFEGEAELLQNGDVKESGDDGVPDDAGTNKRKSRVKDLLQGRRRGLSSDSSSDERQRGSSSDSSSEESDNESLDSTDSFSSDDEDDIVVEDSTEILSAAEIVNLTGSHHLIEAIRIAGLWVMNTTELVSKSGETSAILWLRLSRIFNIISLNQLNIGDNQKILDIVKNMSSIDFPMPEDSLVKGMRFSSATVDWTKHTPDLSPEEIGAVRTLQLQELGRWLTKIPHSRIAESPSGPYYFKPRLEEASDPHSTVDSSEAPPARDGDKIKVMENMAQLWLEQEVKDLEGTHHESSEGCGLRGFAHYSPYLVVDHQALSKNLAAIQDIVNSKRFVTIIPISTVQQLDNLKKVEPGARNSIRWLERQFQEGNRWIRAQKKNETKRLEKTEGINPKKNTDDWHDLKILECCFFFSDGPNSKLKVTLITGEDKVEPKEPFSLHQKAEELGILMETPGNFVKRSHIEGGNKRKGRRRFHRKNSGMISSD